MKPIKSVPAWLSDVKVRFTCETCRQKHPKAVAGYETVVASRALREDDALEDGDIMVVGADEDADDEDAIIEPSAAFEDVPEEP